LQRLVVGSMFSWKERLYALLLKRILGPLLSAESQQKLYTCIQQISVFDGSYIFNDLSFNTDYISSKFINHVVHIVSATVRTVQIDIRLEEETCYDVPDNDGTATTTATISQRLDIARSSLAWRAFKYSTGINTATNSNNSIEHETTTTTGPGPGSGTTPQTQQQKSMVLLVVRIRLEGVEIKIEPTTTKPAVAVAVAVSVASDSFDSQSDRPTIVDEDATQTKASKTSSYLSSYIEAVLASLRLTMEINDLRIRFRDIPRNIDSTFKQQQEISDNKFIELHSQSVIYNDIPNTALKSMVSFEIVPSIGISESQPFYETILNKVLDVSRITILTGTERYTGNTCTPAEIIALLDGSSRLCFRLIEYSKENTISTNDSVANTTISELSKQPNTYTQQDFQVSLHQKLNISIDTTSLQIIRSVVHSFTIQPQPDEDMNISQAYASPQSQQSSSMIFAKGWVQQHVKNKEEDDDDDDDDADYETLESIMAQYREARMLVGKKVMRGGILVPSLDEGGNVTFDTFFDANEHSAIRRSSSLRGSIFSSVVHSNNKQHHATSDWIHRKFTLYLQEGGVKVTFPSSDFTNCSYPNAEYILLTVNDINLSSQFSSRSMTYAFSMNHIEIEDAMFSSGVRSDEQYVIDTSSIPAVEVGTLLQFVPESDCCDDDDTDLLVQAPCLSLSVNIVSDDVNDTMDVELIMEPIEVSYRNYTISKMTQFFQYNEHNNPPVLEKPRHKTISINTSCACLTVLLPVQVDLDCSTLYNRAGYVTESAIVRGSALGFVCERMVFELRINEGVSAKNEALLSCHNILAFVSSAISRYSAFDQRIFRLDFLSLCGRAEVDPCIPISIQCNQFPKVGVSNNNNDSGNSLATSVFPKVPALSSFKARQEDDDDENAQPNNDDNDLKMNDLQSVMLSNLDSTNIVVSVCIPEIILDLCAIEMVAIQTIISKIHKPASKAVVNNKCQDTVTSQQIVCAINCDILRITLHVDSSYDVKRSDKVAFALSMEKCQGYFLIHGSNRRHLRVLVHDFDFLESKFRDHSM
jgi:hypothetical protein